LSYRPDIKTQNLISDEVFINIAKANMYPVLNITAQVVLMLLRQVTGLAFPDLCSGWLPDH
jgi:hypothetical protein